MDRTQINGWHHGEEGTVGRARGRPSSRQKHGSAESGGLEHFPRSLSTPFFEKPQYIQVL